MKPLDDLRVIEFAEMVSGPMCGKLFADMGAEVIKLEPPRTGDEARHHPPFPGDVPHPEKSGLFLYLNTGKKSVTLDVRQTAGAEILRRLIADADVLIENQRPGHLESLGFGYQALHALNPKLIVTSVTPFGQNGPYRDWKGTDLIEWAMSLTGYNTPTLVDDAEKENPLRAPGHPAEMMGATTAAAATMLALRHRDLTGEGQWLDVPCWQSTLNTAKVEMAAYSYKGVPFSRLRARSGAGLEPLACRNGFVYTLWTVDAHFEALKELLGHPELIEGDLFKTMKGRADNDDVIRTTIQAALLNYDMDDLVSRGQALGLPIGAVYTVAHAAEDEHLKARGAFVEIDHPATGRLRYPGALVRLSATPAEFSRAPMLSEHTDEILGRRLGYKPLDLRALRTAGVI
ncbi:MAG TPA: CoA transferase [Candidatus Binataceae bacterium]|nr:CoA transferase [Candidatus Binataceae bacterium]